MKIEKKKNGGGVFFIPAGIFLGFGAGFLMNNLPAGIFIGLGIGFFAFAVSIITGGAE